MGFIFTQGDIEYIKNLLIEAGRIGVEIQRKGVHYTHKRDLTIVTQTDIEIQEFLIQSIKKKYPKMEFIHEEKQEENLTSVNEHTTCAIIDPIDGTAVYTMGLPTWCISVGFYDGFNPRYGFVYSPLSNLFYYNDDSAAYCNDNPILVDRSMSINSETNMFVTAEIFRSYYILFPGKVRNLGSTALHGCMVAHNAKTRTLAYIGRSYLWDWGGIIPILSKAGASLRYLNGKYINIKEIIENSFLLPEYCIAYSSYDYELIKSYLFELKTEKQECK